MVLWQEVIALHVIIHIWRKKKNCSDMRGRNFVFIVTTNPVFTRMKCMRTLETWLVWIVIIHMGERINIFLTEKGNTPK